MPEHYVREAEVILVARQQAAVELLSKLASGGGTPVSPSLSMETLLGEF